MSILSQNRALNQLVATHLDRICKEEELEYNQVTQSLENGSMVLLGNPAHPNLKPIIVGQPARVKVNANLGTSPMLSCADAEINKLNAAMEAGADTIMDLSISGNLDSIRHNMLATCPMPLGTVPLYAVAQRYIDAGKDPAQFTIEELFAEIEKQAEQGVDFMTLHCGLTERGANWAMQEGSRIMGIVSRGGSILARWMCTHKKENPLLENYSQLLEIARKHNVTLSLGDGLRPGAGSDAGDIAQWEEVLMLGHLAQTAHKAGVQCMIEGPGHVHMHEVEAQIRSIKKVTGNVPLYVLGPLVIDSCPGYDHIAGAIGGAIAVRAGADFLCYLTPAEHLTLPTLEDVRAGVLASRIAAQAGEVAIGQRAAQAREKYISEARKRLDWKTMQQQALDPLAVEHRRAEHSTEEVCAMCGKFCAVKMVQPETDFK